MFLGIAFAVSECQGKLLAIVRPSVDVGRDDVHQFTWELESEMGSSMDGQLAFGRGKRWWPYIRGLQLVGGFRLL